MSIYDITSDLRSNLVISLFSALHAEAPLTDTFANDKYILSAAKLYRLVYPVFTCVFVPTKLLLAVEEGRG